MILRSKVNVEEGACVCVHVWWWGGMHGMALEPHLSTVGVSSSFPSVGSPHPQSEIFLNTAENTSQNTLKF